MDEQLDRLMNETLPQVYALGEKPIEYEIQNLYHRITLSELMPSVSDEKLLRLKNERMTKWLDDCGKEVIGKNQENSAIVSNSLSSINDLLASKSDKEEDEIVKYIKESSSLIRQTVTSIDDTIQDTLDSIKDQIQMEYETKQTMLMDSFDPEYFGLEQSSVWSSFVANSSKWLLSHVTVCFKDQMPEKADDVKTIKAFEALISKRFDIIEKSLEQIIINMAKIQAKQDVLKDRQTKLEGLIKKRNEGDSPKKLSRAACVDTIVGILENKNIYINKSAIEKKLYRWDRALERGEKIPVQGYVSARNNKIDFFEVWVKVEFIPYYLKERQKNKTRHSSSEAAFNEAARNQYESRQRQSQYGDDNDSD